MRAELLGLGILRAHRSDLRQSNTRPSRPTRGWAKKIGPGELNRTSNMRVRNSGETQARMSPATHSVADVLGPELPTAWVGVRHRHQRQTTDVIDAAATTDDVEHARDDPDPDAVPIAAPAAPPPSPARRDESQAHRGGLCTYAMTGASVA